MDFRLSDEQKRKIEHEEEARLAEEEYRGEVRKRLAEDPPERKRGSGRTILIVLAVLFVLYLLSKSQQ